MKAFRELFDSVEVSPDADVLHTSYRSDVLNVVNLFGDSGDDDDKSRTTSMMVAFLSSQSLMT